MKNLFFVLIAVAIAMTACKKEDNTPQTVTDADGNEYHTVTIGTQIWMVENLKTTKFNDGTAIPMVTEATSWAGLTTPAYCWYNNDATANKSNGALYNCLAVNTGKLAPKGWHVPTDTEWTILENYLIANGYNYDGTTDNDNDRSTLNKIAKSLTSASGWETSSVEGAPGNTDFAGYKNKSGFNALPIGYRGGSTGTFYQINVSINLWSSSLDGTSKAFYRYLIHNDAKMNKFSNLTTFGFAVRCIKD